MHVALTIMRCFEKRSFLSNLQLTSASLPLFSSFLFQSNSKPFFSLPLLLESILLPLFPTSLLPLSPLLSFPLSDSQIFTADSCTCTAWGRGHCLLFLHSAVNHLISANQKRPVCVSQGIPANMSPGGGKFVEKKSGRKSVSAMYVCVLEQGQHTMCYF